MQVQFAALVKNAHARKAHQIVNAFDDRHHAELFDIIGNGRVAARACGLGGGLDEAHPAADEIARR